MGVCDSRSLLLVYDASSMEIDDASLSQICSAKASGYSLSNLVDLGNLFVLCNFLALVLGFAGLGIDGCNLIKMKCS